MACGSGPVIQSGFSGRLRCASEEGRCGLTGGRNANLLLACMHAQATRQDMDIRVCQTTYRLSYPDAQAEQINCMHSGQASLFWHESIN